MTWKWGSMRELSWQKSDIESDCVSKFLCSIEPRLCRKWRKPSSPSPLYPKGSEQHIFFQVMSNLVSSHCLNPVPALLCWSHSGNWWSPHVPLSAGSVLEVLWWFGRFPQPEETQSTVCNELLYTSIIQPLLEVPHVRHYRLIWFWRLASGAVGLQMLTFLDVSKVRCYLWSPEIRGSWG